MVKLIYIKEGMNFQMPMIFDYEFMRRAFLIGSLLAITVPCIGVIIVLRRMSMVGDALSHMSLAGVALGLIFGFNPILGAVATCVLATFSISFFAKKIPQYAETAIAVIMAAGVGLAGILSGFLPNSANFNSFLFGSIVAVSNFETILVIVIALAVLLTFIGLYNELFFITLDEQGACLAGVPVATVNFIFTLLTAVTVSIAARTVGALIISSMMVIPVICAMQIAKSYKQTVIWSCSLNLVFTLTGLTISYYLGLKPGGTIVIISIIVLVIILLLGKVKKSA